MVNQNTLIILPLFAAICFSQCCLQYQNFKCIQCPSNMHLYQSNCIFDIPNCLEYYDGFQCAKCEDGYEFDTLTTECKFIRNQLSQESIYFDTYVTNAELNTPEKEGFLIIDEYLQTMKPQIRNLQIVGALIRVYDNGTTHHILEYRESSNLYYKAIFEYQQQFFTIREISFEQTPIQTIFPQEAKQRIYNSLTDGITPEFMIFDQQVKTMNTNLLTVIKGIIKEESGSITYELIYAGKQTGAQYEVIGTIQSSTKRVVIQQINQLKQPQEIILNPNTIATNTFSLSQLQYTTFNMNSENPIDGDQYFLGVKDFLYVFKSEVKGLEITSTEKADEGNKIYYRIVFRKPDGNKAIVYVSFNLSSFVMMVEGQQNLKTSQTEEQAYETVPQDQILKDFKFLVALDGIQQEYNNKYQVSQIQELQKKQINSSIFYKVTFKQEQINWIIHAVVNNKNFSVSGFEEYRSPIEDQQRIDILSTNQNNLVSGLDKNTIETNLTEEIDETIVPQTIKYSASGLRKLTKQQLSGKQFSKVVRLLKQSYGKELSDYNLLVGYTSSSSKSFNRKYNVYYQHPNNQIIESIVSQDLLRDQVYVISFGNFGV